MHDFFDDAEPDGTTCEDTQEAVTVDEMYAVLSRESVRRQADDDGGAYGLWDVACVKMSGAAESAMLHARLVGLETSLAAGLAAARGDAAAGGCCAGLMPPPPRNAMLLRAYLPPPSKPQPQVWVPDASAMRRMRQRRNAIMRNGDTQQALRIDEMVMMADLAPASMREAVELAPRALIPPGGAGRDANLRELLLVDSSA